MDIQLTEQIIRERANEQSFQKGLAYYKTGAIYSASRQSTPGGVVLTAHCEGSSAPSYRLRAELDAGGVRDASCTCPYDWGGDCKHLVALLLMYLHQPDKFAEQKSVSDLLQITKTKVEGCRLRAEVSAKRRGNFKLKIEK